MHIFHLLRQSNPEVFIIEEENKILGEGLLFVFKVNSWKAFEGIDTNYVDFSLEVSDQSVT